MGDWLIDYLGDWLGDFLGDFLSHFLSHWRALRGRGGDLIGESRHAALNALYSGHHVVRQLLLQPFGRLAELSETFLQMFQRVGMATVRICDLVGQERKNALEILRFIRGGAAAMIGTMRPIGVVVGIRRRHLFLEPMHGMIVRGRAKLLGMVETAILRNLASYLVLPVQ